jgi:hypothetical protein
MYNIKYKLNKQNIYIIKLHSNVLIIIIIILEIK